MAYPKGYGRIIWVNVPAINKHLKNIFDIDELTKEATISILETVQKEGKREVTRMVEFYRLESILAVGYRVNSSQTTDFRKWATTTLNATTPSYASSHPSKFLPQNNQQYYLVANGKLS